MSRHALLRRALIAIGAFVVFGLSGWGQAQPASAMSCFTIAAKMTCIDAASPPVAGFVPPVVVPIGAAAGGEDHHVVIRDDGGRSVERG